MSIKLLERVKEIIYSYQDQLNEISTEIWKRPEVAFKETFAHKYLADYLEKQGFIVTRNFKLPTAFKAEFCPNPGKVPTVAVLCEYDALPAIGHGCGHNLIAECGIATGLAIKKLLEDGYEGMIGNLVVLGTPAEESGGGKAIMLEKGGFEDIDFAVMAHPSSVNLAHPLKYLSWCEKTVNFSGKAIDKANALDAVIQTYNSVSNLRQKIDPESRIHMNITEGGSDVCQIPDKAQLRIMLRALTCKKMKELEKLATNCIEAATISTMCQVNIQNDSIYLPLLSNFELSSTYRLYAEMSGVVFLDDDPDQSAVTYSSTDMGNVSHKMPGIQPEFFIGKSVPFHTKEFAEVSINPMAQNHVFTAAISLACTAVEVIIDENKFNKVVEEFKESIKKIQHF